jgi:glycosyltransferase involved in cell wall biosynthesis
LASFYLRLSLFFSSQKIAYFVHGYRFHNAEKNYKYFIFYLIEKILSYRTQYYININQEDYFITKKKFLVNPNKILLLPSVGIDVKKIKSFKKKKINKKFKIGVVAAYRKNKGYDDLIKVSEFLQNKANISIDCYGYDNSQKYQKIIDKKKITNIKLYPFKKNLYNKFRSFDLFCHLSRREGMSISIIESICLGIPVIAFNIRGCSDLIKNGYNGFLIEPYDLIKFKNVLLRIIKGDIDIKKIKKNCEVMNLKKHDKNYINTKLINFIKYACQN